MSNTGENPSTPRRSAGKLTHRRHHSHSIANDTLSDIVGGMSAPSSAPRAGRSNNKGGRHARHATHSHFDLEMSSIDNRGMSAWKSDNTVKDSSATMAMAQYLDNVESSDQVHDICSFQDIKLDDAENGKKHHRHTNSSDSFQSNATSMSGGNAANSPRRAHRRYYLMPMMWKHRLPIAACVVVFLACVIVLSTTMQTSMKNSTKGNSRWKDTTMNNENDMEMVGPPLEAVPDEEDDDGAQNSSSSIHQPQQPPPIHDGEGGSLILGPGEAYEEEDAASIRIACMSSSECEARANLFGFPTYEEGPFVDKGCSYEGSTVYWGAGATTTTDDEEDNDLTLEELTAPFSVDSNKSRLWCDSDEALIAIDKVAAALAIAEGDIDLEADNANSIEDTDGVAIVGENFGMEEDPIDDEEGALTVGAPLQIESNPDDNISAEWFSTDSELYTSFIADGSTPHETAMKFCESKNKSLCNYNDYCPEGKSSRVYKGGPDGIWIDNPAESEQWAPVMAHGDASAGNEWVQIGKILDGGDASENFGECWTYDVWMNREDVNVDVAEAIEEEHRRFFLCCDDE